MLAMGRGRGPRPARSACLAVLALLLGLGAVRAEEEGAAGPVWTRSSTGLEVWGVSSLRVHPKRPDLLYAHAHGLGVARSLDEGKTWEVAHEGLDPRHVPGPRDVVEISLDPRDEQVVWLVTKGHVYRSENQGQKWEDRSSGALTSWSWDRRDSAMLIRGVVVDPKKSLHVLAGTRTEGHMRGGLFESTDGGKTWEQIAGNDVPKSELGHDAWPIVVDPRTDKNIAVGGVNGFWFSDDRGRHFKRADPGEIGWHDVQHVTELGTRTKDLYLSDPRGLWQSRDGGKRWDKKPQLEGYCVTAGVSPYTKDRIYAVLRERGLVMSEDARNVRWDDLGGAELELGEILFHPRDKDTIYFASPVTGLYVSRDEGKTLEPVRGNLPAVVPSIAVVSHHDADVDHLLAATSEGVVFRSADRGATWERAGRLGLEPTRLVCDGTTSGGWLAAGHLLMASADHGSTWEVVYRPEDPEDRIVGLHRDESGALTLLLERSHLVVRRAAGEDAWVAAKPPKVGADVWSTSLAVDASRPEHLLVATRTLAPLWTPKDREGGPFESWDGGKTWKPLTEGLGTEKEPLRDWNRGSFVALDPATGLMLYGADGGGVFARRVAPPGEKPKVAPAWIDVSPPLPEAVVRAWARVPAEEEGATPALVLQCEGENDTRLLVRTNMARLLARVVAAEAEQTSEDPLWDTLPDPGARLADLDADPHLPGRLLACDRHGGAGVLLYGIPGEKPAEGAAPSEAQAPVAPPPPPRAQPPAGLLAFTAGGDGGIRVWNLAEEKVISSLRGHTDEVFAIALAPDESLVASGGADKTVRLWDASDGKERGLLGPEEYDATVNALLFAPSSKQLYVAMEQAWEVVAWNLDTQERSSLVAHTGAVLCLAISADGKRLVSGSRDRTIRVWDLDAQASTVKIEFGTEVLTVALSPDGSRVYAGGRGAAVKVFDTSTGDALGFAEIQGSYVSDLALSPSTQVLYVAGDRGLFAVNAEDLTPVTQPAGGRYEGPTKAVFAVAVSRDGRWVVAGDQENGLWVWETQNPTPHWFTTTAHAGAVHGVALTPDVAEAAPSGS